MILKEKLFLANCDSVRQLSPDDVRARFMAGVLFADGVVLSPNLLIDNPAIISLLASKHVQRWFKRDEHNESKLMIRGFGLENGFSLVDYFEHLDANYVVSQLGGVRKGELTAAQATQLKKQLEKASDVLTCYQPSIVSLEKKPGALSEQIRLRLARAATSTTEVAVEAEQQRSVHQRTLALVEQSGKPLGSRSDWYSALGALEIPALQRDQFRLEVVDASYNGLFVGEGEAFVMDRIQVLSRLPLWLLDTGISIGSRREELATLKAGYDLFNFISTLGTEELASILADKALEYAEEKAKAHGVSWCERRNWFGLYPKLTRFMGVELK
ncbi:MULTISPECIES: hypothetical protein [unclassified Halomonas]|uniref:hypothetical protein n=1 Tax=unclassified Halomonas TaxID=2609666 RepID=UPI001EF4B5E8|nr:MULTISPECIES: hypothetical protein [unclassified Halomonas]MCG7592228.1 hypothetical protein [Halomonas sp. McD50-5]MCG7618279.1 hypothetical protein [Halomonas sp. McD50-4]